MPLEDPVEQCRIGRGKYDPDRLQTFPLPNDVAEGEHLVIFFHRVSYGMSSGEAGSTYAHLFPDGPFPELVDERLEFWGQTGTTLQFNFACPLTEVIVPPPEPYIPPPKEAAPYYVWQSAIVYRVEEDLDAGTILAIDWKWTGGALVPYGGTMNRPDDSNGPGLAVVYLVRGASRLAPIVTGTDAANFHPSDRPRLTGSYLGDGTGRARVAFSFLSNLNLAAFVNPDGGEEPPAWTDQSDATLADTSVFLAQCPAAMNPAGNWGVRTLVETRIVPKGQVSQHFGRVQGGPGLTNGQWVWCGLELYEKPGGNRPSVLGTIDNQYHRATADAETGVRYQRSDDGSPPYGVDVMATSDPLDRLPCVDRDPQGRLWLIFNRGDAAYRCTSIDGGATWSDPEMAIPNGAFPINRFDVLGARVTAAYREGAIYAKYQDPTGTESAEYAFRDDAGAVIAVDEDGFDLTFHPVTFRWMGAFHVLGEDGSSDWYSTDGRTWTQIV